jgi:hypothetical protein
MASLEKHLLEALRVRQRFRRSDRLGVEEKILLLTAGILFSARSRRVSRARSVSICQQRCSLLSDAWVYCLIGEPHRTRRFAGVAEMQRGIPAYRQDHQKALVTSYFEG